MSLSRFMKPKSIQRRADTNSTRLRGGKLVPVLAQHFGQSESGIMRQTISLAIVAAKNPADPTAGLSEVLRKGYTARGGHLRP